MNKHLRLVISLLFIAVFKTSAQTPGLIIQPAIGGGIAVLDPNDDGYVAGSTTGFLLNDQLESEIPFTSLAFVSTELSGDQTSGIGCGFTDFVDSGTGNPAQCYFDGTNLIFRIRMGNSLNNSSGYSILIDTDEKFGFTGTDTDPDAQATNPGFEIEIGLFTNSGVYIYDVSGGCPGASSVSHTGYSHYQKSIALSSECGTPDFFFDFYVTAADLAALGLNTSTPVRMVVVSQISPSPAICNLSLSDIAGIEDISCGGISSTCFTSLVTNFTPTPISGFTNTVSSRSNCPEIANLISGNTTISGTTTEPNGTSINVYKNGSLIGSTTSTSGAWSISGISPQLATGDIITATALVSGKSVSRNDCDPETVILACTPALDPALSGECTPKKGFHGDAGGALPGAIIKVYDLNGNLMTPNAGSIYASSTVTVNANGSWVWKCNGNNACAAGANNCIAAGTYTITQTASGFCESEPILICLGNITTATTPTISGTLTATTTTVTGTAGTNARILLYQFQTGVYDLIGTTFANASGNWSISGLTLNECDSVTAEALESAKCESSFATAKKVFGNTTAEPVITGNYCTSTNISAVYGYSTEAFGTTIQIYENGIAEGNTATVDANGAWMAMSGISIAPGSIIRATATASCKPVSPLSDQIIVGVASADPLLAISPVVVYEGGDSVSGTATDGNVISLFIDGYQIGTSAICAAGVWTVDNLDNYDLYAGGQLSVESATLGGCASDEISGSIVQCTFPDSLLVYESAADTICSGLNTTVTLNNSQTGVMYQLYNGGQPIGSTVLGTGGTLTFSTPALNGPEYFRISNRRLGGFNCGDFLADSIEVVGRSLSTPVISYTGTNGPCEGDTLYMSSSYPTNISWNTGETSDTIMVTASGNYSVLYTDNLGCTASSNQVLNFHAIPVTPVITNISGPGYCLHDTTTLSISAITGCNYQWRRFGTDISGATGTNLEITRPGNYIVTATDAYGCYNYSSYLVTATPAVPVIVAIGDTIICNNETAQLAVTPQPGLTYEWRKFGTIIPGSSGINYAAGSNGKYSCIATNSYGCTRVSNPISVTVVINIPSISASGPEAICPGDSLTLNVSALPGTTFQWKKYGIDVPGATLSTYTITNEGQYRCTGTDTYGCVNTSNIITIAFTPAKPIITTSGPTAFCPGGSVNLQTTPVPGFSYQWKKYNNLVPNANQPNLTVSLTGRYKCIITDSMGCSRQSDPVDVVASCRMVNPSNDGPLIVSVFPNPSDNFFRLETNTENPESLEIVFFDISGRAIPARISFHPQGVVEIHDLPEGVFFATIRSATAVTTVKLVRSPK